MQTARRWVLLGLRTLIGGLFIYAGTIKWRMLGAFAENIASYRILPASLNNILAIGLPPFEILTGAWLISGIRARTAAFIALAVTGVFLVALGSALVRGLPVECGCFGGTGGGWPPAARLRLAFGRDLLLFCATLAVYFDARGANAPRPTRTAWSFPRGP